MSSVVLDFNKSISISDLYWEKLSSELTLKNFPLVQATPAARSIILPLNYYYRDKIDKLSEVEIHRLYQDLENGKQNLIYDSTVLQSISDLGITLPQNHGLVRDRIDGTIIGESLEVIKAVLPAAYSEILSYLCGFLIIETLETRSLTSPSWFGCIFLGHTLFDRRDLVEITTSIIHETGHLALFASSSLASPLEDLLTQHFSPFKQAHRPAYMVLHAQIALARMILWLSALKSFVLKGQKLDERFQVNRIAGLLNEFALQFLEGMNSIEHLSFTSEGLTLLNDFEKIRTLLAVNR